MLTNERLDAVVKEARKVLETLNDRAQAEVKVLARQAGAELERLGKKLQQISTDPQKPAEPPAAPPAA